MARESRSSKTYAEIFDELNEEQKQMVYYLVGKAIQETKKQRRWPFA